MQVRRRRLSTNPPADATMALIANRLSFGGERAKRLSVEIFRELGRKQAIFLDQVFGETYADLFGMKMGRGDLFSLIHASGLDLSLRDGLMTEVIESVPVDSLLDSAKVSQVYDLYRSLGEWNYPLAETALMRRIADYVEEKIRTAGELERNISQFLSKGLFVKLNRRFQREVQS